MDNSKGDVDLNPAAWVTDSFLMYLLLVMGEAVNSLMFGLCGRVLEVVSKSSVYSPFLQSCELLSMSFKKISFTK